MYYSIVIQFRVSLSKTYSVTNVIQLILFIIISYILSLSFDLYRQHKAMVESENPRLSKKDVERFHSQTFANWFYNHVSHSTLLCEYQYIFLVSNLTQL